MHKQAKGIEMRIEEEIIIDFEETYAPIVLMSIIQKLCRCVLMAERGKSRKSQKQFGTEELFDMSGPQISKYESGKHDFNLMPVIKLLCASGIPIKVRVDFSELEEYLETNFASLTDEDSKAKADNWKEQLKLHLAMFNQGERY